MKIAILGAMDEEISRIKSSLLNINEVYLSHLALSIGELGSHQVFLLKCGIGKVASSVSAALVLEKYQPDLIINTGSAGGFDARLEVGDIVIADSVVHHDVDLTAFGYELGQCANMPATYATDKNYVKEIIKCADKFPDVKTIIGTIATGDSFIGTDEDAQKLKKNFNDIAAVEMEGAAIAQTAYLMKVPCLIIRSLSDIAGQESPVSFEQYLKTAAENSAKLVMDFIKQV